MSDWMSQIDWGTAGLLAANTLAVLRPFAERFINKALDKTAEKSVEAVFDLLEEKADEGEVEEWAGNPDDDYFRKRLERLLKNDPEFAETLRAAMVSAVKDVQAAGYQVQVQTGIISGNTGSIIVVSGGPVQQTIDQRQGTFIEKQINNPPAPAPPDPVESQRRAAAEAEVAARRTYLEALIKKCSVLPLGDFGSTQGDVGKLTLEHVYTSLDVFVPPAAEQKEAGRRSFMEQALDTLFRRRPLETPEPDHMKPDEIDPRHEPDGRLQRQPALGLAGKHARMVLLGDPGSGKTTFVYSLLIAQANALLGKPVPQTVLPPAFDRTLLPVRVILRDLRPALRTLDVRRCTQEERLSRLQGVVIEQAVTDLTRLLDVSGFEDGLRAALTAGRCLLVLDGLDELPREERRQAVECIKALNVQRMLVTCRILSYTEEVRLPDNLFPWHVLAPFDERQIRAFANAWYDGQSKIGLVDPGDVDDKAEDLAENALREDWKLRKFAGNPMLLTTMAIVHQRRKLPDQRVQLYKAAVKVLLLRWQAKLGQTEEEQFSDELQRLLVEDELKTLLRLAEHLAYGGHQTRAGQDNDLPADLPWDQAQVILAKALREMGLVAPGLADELLAFMDKQAGLVLGRGGSDAAPEVYSFPHRTFQEYLAGCYLLKDYDDDDETRLIKTFEQIATEGDYWDDAVQFAAEELLHNSERNGATRLRRLATQLLPGDVTTEARARLTMWVGTMGELVGKSVFETTERTREVLQKMQAGLGQVVMGQHLPAIKRATAGRVLAQLGDPRPGVGVDPATGLPDIAWCVVPGGPFVMGSGEYDDEKPQHENGLLKDGYWLGQYPVTQAQFAVFVQAGGYADRRYWGEAEKAGYWKNGQFRGRTGPNTYRGAFGLPNHPVVGVNWYEALAFARWLEEQYRAKGWLPAGYGVTLPSEAEWEKAARGGLKLPSEPLPVVNGAGLARGVPPVAGWQDNPNPKREYPWGNDITPEHANYDKTRIGTTSAVGAFAGQGGSPYGCLDLSGNVFEWTRSVYWAYDKTAGYDRPAERENLAADSNTRRVLRGGSWGDYDFWTCAAYRNDVYGNPNYHADYIGFRVCVPVLAPRFSAL